MLRRVHIAVRIVREWGVEVLPRYSLQELRSPLLFLGGEEKKKKSDNGMRQLYLEDQLIKYFAIHMMQNLSPHENCKCFPSVL